MLAEYHCNSQSGGQKETIRYRGPACSEMCGPHYVVVKPMKSIIPSIAEGGNA